ncbi:MAG TPA: transglycosylase SLT domain-containing protein [Longimicrobiales bacterium]
MRRDIPGFRRRYVEDFKRRYVDVFTRRYIPEARWRELVELGGRYIPKIQSFYARARRPAIMIVLGLALIAPGGAVLVRGERAPAADPVGGLAGVPLDARLAAAKSREGPVAAAWRRKAMQREADKIARRLAREFGVSISLAEEITRAALENGIEPRVAFGLVQTESSFRRTAVSHAGAIGYTQVLPSTARWLLPGTSRRDLFDTRTNLRVGFKYLRYLLNKYDGDIRLALTAYNRGPGTVDRLLRRGRNPENGYADKVLS